MDIQTVTALIDTQGPDITGRVVDMPAGSTHYVSGKDARDFYANHPDTFTLGAAYDTVLERHAAEHADLPAAAEEFTDGSAAAPSIAFAADPDTGLYRIGANNLGVAAGGAKVLDIATTGLSVTGTLSATGSMSVVPTTGTNPAWLFFNNDSGAPNSYIGQDGSVAGLDTAYSLNVWNGSNTPIIFGVNNAKVGSWTTTGLAVTGALGATGNITSTAGQIISQGATAALVAFPRDGSGSEFSLYNPTGDALHVYGSSADIATFSSTGLAVTGVLTLNETVPAGITLNVFNASKTGTTMGGNTLLRLASNASGADSTIQFTDSVANNAYISGKSGHIYIQPTTAGISVADFSSTALSPGADNTYNLGSASLGWKELFCDNGTINTSDARRKTEVSALSAAEINAAKQLAKEIGSFKFLAAVAEKGDAARNHIGMTVQRSIAIMEANGLNPFAYSFICHDAWDDEFAQEQTNVGQKVVKTRRVERQMVAERTESVTAIEMRDGMPTLVTKEIVKTDPVFHDILVCGEDGRAVMVVDQPATDAVLDDAGVEIEPARAATFKPLTHPVPTMEWVTESYEEDAPPTYVTVKVRDAGDKYSFRVHELLLFMLAGMVAQ